MAATAGIIGGVGSLAGAAGSIFGGGSSAWHPSGTLAKQLSSTANNDLSAIQPYALNYASQTIPQFQQATSAYQNNPYYGEQQSAAQSGYNYGIGSLVPQLQGSASSLTGLGNLATSYAPQLAASAFDPQSALYARTAQQVNDQVNANNAMYGLSSSPYGAGVANEAASNFNIDWQNNQLNRELTGAQGLSSLGQTAGAAYGGANSAAGQIPGVYSTAGSLPYSTYQNNAYGDLQALGMLNSGVAGALQPSQTSFNNATSLLGQGNAGQAQAFNQNQVLGSNLGSSLSALQSSLTSPSISSLFNNNSSNVDATPYAIGYVL